MKLFGLIEKVEQQDDGTIKVYGIATTESVDDQGETVKGSAIRAALPDYLKFPALREMHQLSAAGTTLEAEVGDDNITRMVARVVDPVAISKVKNLVYRGFSIGGRVTQREAGNPKTITGIVLNEISLVDRPANPDATLDLWKASSMQTEPAPTAAFNPPIQIWACSDPSHRHLVKSDAMRCLETAATDGAAAQQAQLDAAVKALEPAADAGAHTDPPAAVGAAVPILEPPPAPEPAAEPPTPEPQAAEPPNPSDPPAAGFLLPAADSAPLAPAEVVPPDTASVIAALRQSLAESEALLAQVDINGVADPAPATAEPPAVEPEAPAVDPAAKVERAGLGKGLYDVCRTAELIAELDWLHNSIAFEAEIEGDGSPQPARLKAIIVELCGFLNAQVAEETAELLADADVDDDDDGPVMTSVSPIALSAVVRSLRKTITDTAQLETLVEQLEKAGARHNKSDQAHLDTIAFALHKAMGLGTAKRAELAELSDAHKTVLDIGATALNADGRQMLTNSEPAAESPTTHATVDTGHAGRITTPNQTGAVPATPHPPSVSKAAGATASPAFLMIEAMAKSGNGHGPLAACAHGLLQALSDGATCKEGAAKPTRHNVDDMARMHKLHAQLCRVDGVQCAGGEEPAAKVAASAATAAPAAPVPAAAVLTDDGPLNKAMAEKDALTKLLGDIVPIMETMKKQISEIHAQPMPAALVANVGATDATRSNTGAAAPVLTSDQIAKGLRAMSVEESTLTLIKARQPIWINSHHQPPTQREARDELEARKA